MNLNSRPRRSALYMPASNPRAVDKARGLSCDVVILDLEDAVLPDAKVDARAAAIEALATGGFGQREMVIRVNALSTPWGLDDLAAAATAAAGIAAAARAVLLAPTTEAAARASASLCGFLLRREEPSPSLARIKSKVVQEAKEIKTEAVALRSERRKKKTSNSVSFRCLLAIPSEC